MNRTITSPKPISTNSFDKRINIGRNTEICFRKHLERLGLTVIEASQHLANQQSEMAKHFPDFFVVEWCVFIQVKSAINSSDFPDVIAEQSSYEACKKIYEYGASVKMVWLFPDGTWRGQFIEKINPKINPISDAARKNGSGTPAVKIPKSQLELI